MPYDRVIYFFFETTKNRGIPASIMPVPSTLSGWPQQYPIFRPIPMAGMIIATMASFPSMLRLLMSVVPDYATIRPAF